MVAQFLDVISKTLEYQHYVEIQTYDFHPNYPHGCNNQEHPKSRTRPPSCKNARPLQLLQQNLDEPFLLRTIQWKPMTISRESIELIVRLESKQLEIWVAAMVNEVE